MKVATNNPIDLIEEINKKIEDNIIRTWHFENNIFTHKGEQYKDHFYISYNIDTKKSIIEFELNSDGDPFSELKAMQLFKNMIITHFEEIVEIMK